ncbi:hypothetical protein BJ508DRAFT_364743 [Ascobolus immersus RN42]|uniref:Uncharacterized protein n=1 Tax=Ascobolus immersus RN42 TaxID=1160509 RepID=A0A3N4HT92_ASCIM|nr:hypothetical protein BJ508DRAFT_364743 [Ascobolus immersus RN42]
MVAAQLPLRLPLRNSIPTSRRTRLEIPTRTSSVILECLPRIQYLKTGLLNAMQDIEAALCHESFAREPAAMPPHRVAPTPIVGGVEVFANTNQNNLRLLTPSLLVAQHRFDPPHNDTLFLRLSKCIRPARKIQPLDSPPPGTRTDRFGGWIVKPHSHDARFAFKSSCAIPLLSPYRCEPIDNLRQGTTAAYASGCFQFKEQRNPLGPNTGFIPPTKPQPTKPAFPPATMASTNPFLASTERIHHYDDDDIAGPSYDHAFSPAPPRYSEEFPTNKHTNQFYGDSKHPPMPTIPQHSPPRPVTHNTTTAVLTSTTTLPQRSGSVTSFSSEDDSPVTQSDVSMDVSTYFGSSTHLPRNDSTVASWVRQGRNQTSEDLRRYRNSRIATDELERRKKEVEERVRREIERDVQARQEMMRKEIEEVEEEMRRKKAARGLGRFGTKKGRIPIKPTLNTGVSKSGKLTKPTRKTSTVESIRRNVNNPFINEISSPLTPLSPLPAVSYSTRPPLPKPIPTNTPPTNPFHAPAAPPNAPTNPSPPPPHRKPSPPLAMPSAPPGAYGLSAPNSPHLSTFSATPDDESPSPITGPKYITAYPTHLDPFTTPSAPSAASFRQDITGKSTDNSVHEKKLAPGNLYLQFPAAQSQASSIYSTQTSGVPKERTPYDNIAREERYARRHSGGDGAAGAGAFGQMQKGRFPIAPAAETRRFSDSSVHGFIAPQNGGQNGVYISSSQVNMPSRFSVEKGRREKEEGAARRKRWRNRCLCLCGLRWKYWCIALGVILLCGLGGGLAAFFVLKSRSSAAAAAVVAEEAKLKISDIMASPPNGQPALPSVLAVMRPSGAPVVNATCVSPPQLWSCSLPPELRDTPLSNGPDLGGIGFDIRLLNTSSNSVLTKPSPAAVPDTADYAALALVDGVFNSTTPQGEETQFIASLTFPKIVQDPFFSGLQARQVSSPAENPSELFPPVLKNQPLRLMDRGLDTEHYAFHTYYRKSIYIPDPAKLLEDVDDEDVDYAAMLGAKIPKGGLDGKDAGYVCMFDVTRLSVKIFTASPPSLEVGVVRPGGERVGLDVTLNKFLEQQTSFLAAEKEGKAAERPEFPLPVSVEIDRVGKGEEGRTSSCFKVVDGRVVLSEGRLGVAESTGILKPKKGEKDSRVEEGIWKG